MPNRNDDRLVETIKAVAGKVQRFREKGLGEQNTKASMVEPILEALGWDIRDPEEVHREFKPMSRDNPVDYALKILRKPRLFVEAKGLGEDIADRRWVAQVLGYATVAGVEWCVLTDGDEYRFYNATVALDADEKLFCKLRLSEANEDDAVRSLRLISRSNMEENLISVLWSAHFVDRQVRECLESMIESADRRLVRLIRARSTKLSSGEIAESLRRLDVRIEPPSDLPVIAGTPIVDQPSADDGRSDAARKAWQTRRSRAATENYGGEAQTIERKPRKATVRFGVKLIDLINAEILKPPVTLFRKYKNVQLEATLSADGVVIFQGESFPSASTAAESARATVSGERKSTNGWQFWKFKDSAGKTLTLDDAREHVLTARRNSPIFCRGGFRRQPAFGFL